MVIKNMENTQMKIRKYEVTATIRPEVDKEEDPVLIGIADQTEIIGTEEDIKNYVEKRAQEVFPGMDFLWVSDEDYESLPFHGKVFHLDYEDVTEQVPADLRGISEDSLIGLLSRLKEKGLLNRF